MEGNIFAPLYLGMTWFDIRNQHIISELKPKNLHNVLATVVDYEGLRILCQTPIPGLLGTGNQTATIMYGSLDLATPLTCKKEALDVMTELANNLKLSLNLRSDGFYISSYNNSYRPLYLKKPNFDTCLI